MRALVAINLPRPPTFSSNFLPERRSTPTRNPFRYPNKAQRNTQCLMGANVPQGIRTTFQTRALVGVDNAIEIAHPSIPNPVDVSELRHSLLLAEIDPATAKLAIPFIGPFLSAFAFLFIVRIVMSWYPKLPVGKFPYVLAYAPTEPILIPTRKVIPPLGGVDITPVVWFALLSFMNEILVGPQGLLVLISQQR